jgi:hypothetical protein
MMVPALVLAARIGKPRAIRRGKRCGGSVSGITLAQEAGRVLPGRSSMPIMVRATGCIGSMVIALVACDHSSASSGGSDAGAAASGRIGSCDRAASTGTCSEYRGTYLTENEILLTSSCGKLGGTFVYAECPNTSVVGACTLSTSEVHTFYGTGASAYEPDRARKECEASFHGAWKAR